MSIASTNPATGETVHTYEPHSDAELDAALDAAREAFASWRRRSFEERARPLREAASLLRERQEELALLMALEMGKPLREGRAEADKCAWVCEHYAENGTAYLREEPISSDASESFVTFEPLGTVLAVMPWNFPLWQVFRFVAPGLMAGNTALLKHASNVPGCALAIESILQDAGVPDGVFRTLLVGSDKVAELIADRRIAAVTLTGSTPAGRAVAAAAGKALKKTVLELGGSDPYVILDDANLEEAVPICVTSRLINGGQSCIAAKRFLVTERRCEELESRMRELLAAKTMGDPTGDVDIGPQARHDLRDELHEQVTQSLERGARCLLGGEVPDGPGAYYPPTLLTDVAPGMPAADEELFGPVAAILPVGSEEEALRLANASSFGLGAAIFTTDIARGRELAARELEAGCCFVNDFVRSDPRLPFGGIKESGYGRELSSFGIREFTNVKTVYVK